MAKSTRKVRSRIDRRDWRQYNRWQSEEVVLACRFLKTLVESPTVHHWERRRGRPRVSRRELVLCLLVRAYFHLSFRRTVGLLKLLKDNLGLAHVPHFNTLQKYNRGDGLTRTLENLFNETARPFWAVERVLAIDATGLVLFGSGAWRSNHDPEAVRDFAKLHVLSGTATRGTLAVRVTRGTWHDPTQLGPIVENVPEVAVAEALAGDGAYWTRSACEAAHAAGLQPYLSPRENARWPTHPVDAFNRMTRFALQFPNRWAARYHRRSAAESRFATEKGLFGDRLRCRRPTSRRNEVLAREIVHNVRLLTKCGSDPYRVDPHLHGCRPQRSHRGDSATPRASRNVSAWA